MSNKLRTREVFIAGGSGYLGRHLVPLLLERGHRVRALVRGDSQKKLPPHCEAVVGDALDTRTFQDHVAPADTFVHLVGVSNPNPRKSDLFHKVDLASVQAAVAAAVRANVSHLVYVSVAHPAPVMKVYVEVRVACEQIIRDSDLNATILRPWYVLGPGHWWPYILVPLYKLFELFPATAETARRLGLVKLPHMVRALQRAVEKRAKGIRVVEAPEIRGTT